MYYVLTHKGDVKMNSTLYKSQNHHIHIDTSKRTLTLYSNGELLKSYPIAIGKPTELVPT